MFECCYNLLCQTAATRADIPEHLWRTNIYHSNFDGLDSQTNWGKDNELYDSLRNTSGGIRLFRPLIAVGFLPALHWTNADLDGDRKGLQPIRTFTAPTCFHRGDTDTWRSSEGGVGVGGANNSKEPFVEPDWNSSNEKKGRPKPLQK